MGRCGFSHAPPRPSGGRSRPLREGGRADEPSLINHSGESRNSDRHRQRRLGTFPAPNGNPMLDLVAYNDPVLP